MCPVKWIQKRFLHTLFINTVARHFVSGGLLYVNVQRLQGPISR